MSDALRNKLARIALKCCDPDTTDALDKIVAAMDRAALSAPPPVVPAGMVWVSVELLQDAARSIDDYRGGLEFSSHDRRLIGRLKAAADQSQPQR